MISLHRHTIFNLSIYTFLMTMCYGESKGIQFYDRPATVRSMAPSTLFLSTITALLIVIPQPTKLKPQAGRRILYERNNQPLVPDGNSNGCPYLSLRQSHKRHAIGVTEAREVNSMKGNLCSGE